MQASPIKLFAFVELAVVSLLAFLALCYAETAGAFSRHMMFHIALMTVVAPVLAAFIRSSVLFIPLTGSKSLTAAALLQTASFFVWHSPPGLTAIGQFGVGAVQTTLLLSACWFWLAVFNLAGTHLWRTVVALVLTGKLFCLFAVLLTFAPRVLYGGMLTNPAISIDLADQQLAGLLMITACPLTYVLAAIVLIYRWFQDLCDSQSDIAHPALASENES
jgi:putative membrane protein